MTPITQLRSPAGLCGPVEGGENTYSFRYLAEGKAEP
jgi:hypothetical protein